MKRSSSGFTLIELVVAAGLVALLAIIALPRHREAQARSRVSQARADLRQLAVGVEAYALDNQNRHPFDVDPRGFPWYVTDVLTTPISYLPGDSIPSDPFGTQVTPLLGRYRFMNFPSNRDPGAWPPCYLPPPPAGPYHTRWFTVSAGAVDNAIAQAGPWKLVSRGPDGVYNSTGFFGLGAVYDPTNGTVSGGDLIRVSGLRNPPEGQ